MKQGIEACCFLSQLLLGCREEAGLTLVWWHHMKESHQKVPQEPPGDPRVEYCHR